LIIPHPLQNYMRSLFFKIFLWFWAATAMVTVALYSTTVLIVGPPRDQAYKKLMPFYAATAAKTIENEGQQALNQFLDSLEKEADLRAYLLDSSSREVSGREPPPAVRGFAVQARKSKETQFFVAGLTHYIAKSTQGPGGSVYILVAKLPPIPAIFSHIGRQWSLPLIVCLLTAGVVCYWLARYITAPIVKLRDATQRLAAGDLAARIAPAVGKRQDELADLGHDFDFMAGRIESLVEAQRRLLGDISHELRSPLARLNIALGIARQRAGIGASGALDRIEREAERLNKLIEQLLILTRLESGTAVTGFEPVDLARLVQEIGADADFEARNRNRAVRVRVDEECRVAGNALLLRSAVENVVRNAVRYAPEGTEVEITLACRQDDDGGNAVICVRDHGTGVPDEALEDLFQPFYRVAGARERLTGGIGLGLAITRRVVQLHGGMVKAANMSGNGLVVEIRLPIAGNRSHNNEASGSKSPSGRSGHTESTI
jgi:two-component system sensor histidine kinase CpxA